LSFRKSKTLGAVRTNARQIDFSWREPREMPYEQASRFELVINLKIAKKLGLEVAADVLARADYVIG
jgi:putative ABC transport system substrate-binding protein